MKSAKKNIFQEKILAPVDCVYLYGIVHVRTEKFLDKGKPAARPGRKARGSSKEDSPAAEGNEEKRKR